MHTHMHMHMHVHMHMHMHMHTHMHIHAHAHAHAHARTCAHRVDGHKGLAVHAALAEQRCRAEGLAAAERARPRHDASVLDHARLLGRRHRGEVGGRVRLGRVSSKWSVVSVE